jgi:hypothetical protein
MITSDVNAGERVKAVRCGEDTLQVDLIDGRTIIVPLTWYPRLLHATPTQRAHWRVSGGGFGIHWPEIDEDLSTEGLLRGAPAPRGSLQFGKQGLAMAYGDNEPDYSTAMIGEPHVEYAVEPAVSAPISARVTEETLIRVVRDLPSERQGEVLDYALIIKAKLMEKAAMTGFDADKYAWMQASIRSLAKYWDTPEEDAAWAYLQEGMSS